MLEHKEFKRIAPQSDTAVLFIHGIVGTPNHFDPFVRMVPRSVSVYNLLLDGHGKGTKDFSHTSMKKWEAQVRAAVDELSLSHEKIYVVAHSMGTLLAVEQAIRTSKIVKLFLLAVPLKILIRPKMITNSLKVLFDRVTPDDPVATAAKNCYGIEQDKNPFHYIGWIPRYLELLAKIRHTRKTLHLLRTACAVYQSRKDEMVSTRSAIYLKQNPCISVAELSNSTHFYYDRTDMSFLSAEFMKFIGGDI